MLLACLQENAKILKEVEIRSPLFLYFLCRLLRQRSVCVRRTVHCMPVDMSFQSD